MFFQLKPAGDQACIMSIVVPSSNNNLNANYLKLFNVKYQLIFLISTKFTSK